MGQRRARAASAGDRRGSSGRLAVLRHRFLYTPAAWPLLCGAKGSVLCDSVAPEARCPSPATRGGFAVEPLSRTTKPPLSRSSGSEGHAGTHPETRGQTTRRVREDTRCGTAAAQAVANVLRQTCQREGPFGRRRRGSSHRQPAQTASVRRRALRADLVASAPRRW